MKKFLIAILFGFTSILFFINNAAAHCEIPCGIYDDEMRIKLIREHIDTIEKSMKEIEDIEKNKQHTSNQLIRWIMNKEQHANKLQEIVTQYFMTQRIKIDDKNYDKKISSLHQMLIYAMKCKQTTDLANVNKLRDLVKDFQTLYFGKK